MSYATETGLPIVTPVHAEQIKSYIPEEIGQEGDVEQVGVQPPGESDSCVTVCIIPSAYFDKSLSQRPVRKQSIGFPILLHQCTFFFSPQFERGWI